MRNDARFVGGSSNGSAFPLRDATRRIRGSDEPLRDSSGSLPRDLAVGALAGLLGDLAVATSDPLMSRLVSDEQKRREHAVREGSPHEVGGRKFGERIAHRELSETEARRAQMAFTLGYGVVWGAIYAVVRRQVPQASSMLGLPYAVAFFVACDGILAPANKLSPGLQRIPWQFNLKEMCNHIVWTAAAELLHRAVEAGVRRTHR